MKKALMKPLITIACLAFASTAFAATLTSAGTSIGGGTFKTSTKVNISIKANATNYAAVSRHETGSKQYGTLSGDPKIQTTSTLPTGTSPDTVTSETALPGSGWQ